MLGGALVGQNRTRLPRAFAGGFSIRLDTVGYRLLADRIGGLCEADCYFRGVASSGRRLLEFSTRLVDSLGEESVKGEFLASCRRSRMRHGLRGRGSYVWHRWGLGQAH